MVFLYLMTSEKFRSNKFRQGVIDYGRKDN